VGGQSSVVVGCGHENYFVTTKGMLHPGSYFTTGNQLLLICVAAVQNIKIRYQQVGQSLTTF
jgi:hypothetical protein